jgi:hypothetical protein
MIQGEDRSPIGTCCQHARSEPVTIAAAPPRPERGSQICAAIEFAAHTDQAAPVPEGGWPPLSAHRSAPLSAGSSALPASAQGQRSWRPGCGRSICASAIRCASSRRPSSASAPANKREMSSTAPQDVGSTATRTANPWRRGLRELRPLPRSVRGPVLRAALSRLAFSLAGDVMGSGSDLRSAIHHYRRR